MHFEQGIEDDVNLDMYLDVPAQDSDFEGSWHVESWNNQPDNLSFVVTLNRYLPIWTYDKYEYYFNDFRWSPSRYNPPI